MKIVILDAHTTNPGDLSWEELKNLGELTIYERTPKDQIVERIADAEVILTNKTPITAETLNACPKLKFISTLATGYNTVDTNAAKAKGINVSNIPAYSTESVGQLVFAHLLEICHNVGHHSAAVKDGKWQNSVDFTFWDYPLIELMNKTMGIVGFGQIGQQVGKIAKAMGMKVIACDPNPSNNKIADEYVSLDDLLKNSDVISLHCPLFPETEGLINKDSIAKMKDGVILINCSRGPVIAEQDVADALNSGKIYAAGVDVVSVEPILADNPLLKAKNCFITPHIAWAPLASRARLIGIATANVKAFIEGKPQNVVNL